MKSVASLLLSICALVCILSASAFAVDATLNQPGKDFRGTHTVPAETSDATLQLGTLLDGGVIRIDESCTDIDIRITPGNKDLEGLITIKDHCKNISIDIHDSFDTSGKVIIGKDCSVKIRCGSDFNGIIDVGAGSKVKIVTHGESTGKIIGGNASLVTINGSPVK